MSTSILQPQNTPPSVTDRLGLQSGLKLACLEVLMWLGDFLSKRLLLSSISFQKDLQKFKYKYLVLNLNNHKQDYFRLSMEMSSILI